VVIAVPISLSSTSAMRQVSAEEFGEPAQDVGVGLLSKVIPHSNPGKASPGEAIGSTTSNARSECPHSFSEALGRAARRGYRLKPADPGSAACNSMEFRFLLLLSGTTWSESPTRARPAGLREVRRTRGFEEAQVRQEDALLLPCGSSRER
jgi:hypothetical protein